MPFKLPDDHQGHSLAVSSVSSSLNLENYRERFETQLLKVLWQYDLEDEDVGLLSPETAQLLQDNLERLCVLLNEVANDDLQCSAGEETPERTLPVSPTGYPRLEKVLFRAEQSKGPLELATGSTLSLFKLDTLAIALGAHSVVKEFSRSLNAVRGTSSTGRGYAPTTRESRKTQATPHAWLHTFDRSYRAYLGSILDTLKSDFSKCVEPDHVESATHELRLQLLNLESLNQPVSSIKPNLLVYCPKSESWQNAVCHIHRLVLRSWSPVSVPGVNSQTATTHPARPDSVGSLPSLCAAETGWCWGSVTPIRRLPATPTPCPPLSRTLDCTQS